LLELERSPLNSVQALGQSQNQTGHNKTFGFVEALQGFDRTYRFGCCANKIEDFVRALAQRS